jgi:biotin synthase
MCLTIPAQITRLKNKNEALVKSLAGKKVVQTAALPGLRVGDWVLAIGGKAFKKIDSREAEEIINLFKPALIEKSANLSWKFQKILEAVKTRDLTKSEITYLLKTKDKEKETLFSEANLTRQAFLKDFICIHGIIEFSNYCKNDCEYCGLRLENKEVRRYRMTIPEIVKTARAAVRNGYKLLVLQSGEDYFYTDEMLAEIIRRIKEKCRVFVFMSVGERGYNCYKKMKQTGASGVLFRFETSNHRLFKKYHPQGKNFESRFEHLKFMKELGYFIATGSLIGLPGPTLKDLADDILITKKWANMVSMGPFIPAADTPLERIKNVELRIKNYGVEEKIDLTLKMIAILRLMMKEVRIPVTTALETLAGEEGRKKALWAGANSLMFNLTPVQYRPHYKIYPDKFFKKEEMWEKYGLFKYEESYKMLEERMSKEIEKGRK